VATQAPAYELPIDQLTGSWNPSLWVLPLLGVPTMLHEFFPLRASIWCSVDGSHPTWKHKH